MRLLRHITIMNNTSLFRAGFLVSNKLTHNTTLNVDLEKILSDMTCCLAKAIGPAIVFTELRCSIMAKFGPDAVDMTVNKPRLGFRTCQIYFLIVIR